MSTNNNDKTGLQELVCNCTTEIAEAVLNVLEQAQDPIDENSVKKVRKLLSSDEVIRRDVPEK